LPKRLNFEIIVIKQNGELTDQVGIFYKDIKIVQLHLNFLIKVTFAQHFDRPTRLDGDNGLKNWIEMFGGNLFEGMPENVEKEIITKVEQNLIGTLYNQEDHSWTADYKRIRVIGIKN
jgi:hypothetical protein